MPRPRDIKVVKKSGQLKTNKCVCEICVCGRHRCKHRPFNLKLNGKESPCLLKTEYKERFDQRKAAEDNTQVLQKHRKEIQEVRSTEDEKLPKKLKSDYHENNALELRYEGKRLESSHVSENQEQPDVAVRSEEEGAIKSDLGTFEDISGDHDNSRILQQSQSAVGELKNKHLTEYNQSKMGQRNTVQDITNTPIGDSVYRQDFTGLHSDLSIERVKNVRPQTTLRPPGGIDPGTVHTESYKGVSGEASSIVKPEKSDILKGDDNAFASSTTNRDYDGKSGSPAEGIRPSTTKLNIGEFQGGSSYSEAYRGQIVDKTVATRPESSIKRSDGQLEQMTTTKQDYQKWEASRDANKARPKTTLKQDGPVYNLESVNQSSYKEIPLMERKINARPTDEDFIKIDDSSRFDTTTAKTDYQKWDFQKAVVKRPKDYIQRRGDQKFETTNKTDFTGETGVKTQKVVPKTTELHGREFYGETTNMSDFKPWQADKTKIIKPISSEIQSGTFSGRTTQKDSYKGAKGNRVNAIKPKPEQLWETGPMETVTLSQSEYIDWKGQVRPENKRPKSEIGIARGRFYDDTTSKSEFKEWHGENRKTYRVKSSLKNEGKQDFETTNRREFTKQLLDKHVKERPKTMMKIEGGKFDERTTNNHDFQGQSVDRRHQIKRKSEHEWGKGELDTNTTNQIDYQKWESNQQRPVQIRPKSNHKWETGPFDAVTTSKDDYKQWNIQQKQNKVEPRNELMWQSEPITSETTSKSDYKQWNFEERREKVRPRSDHQWETGSFQKDTTNKSDYVNWPGYTRPKLKRHKSELTLSKEKFNDDTTTKSEFQEWHGEKPKSYKLNGTLGHEGEHNFLTTNKQDFTGTPTVKRSRPRPTTTIKLTDSTSGDTFGETTNKRDFKDIDPKITATNWKSLKARPYELINTDEDTADVRSNRQNISSEFQRETGPIEIDTLGITQNKLLERRQIPSQQKTPVERKNKESLFNDAKTNEREVADKLFERAQPLRRSREHEWETGPMETDTSNKLDYKHWKEHQRPIQQKPRDEIEVDKGAFIDETTNNIEFTDKLIVRPKPTRRSSEHQWETGPMETDTSNKVDYRQPEQQSKPKQEKPKDEIGIKEGKFDHETTNKTEFTDKVIERRQPIRRSNQHQWETGQMETDTSNKADYKQWEQQSNPKQEKPRDELEIEGKFDHQTTNKTEFTDKLIERRKPIRRSSEHQWETGPMESDTSNKADYRQPEQQSKPRQQKPKDELDIKEGTFDHETTNKTEFTDKLIERRKPIRRSSEHQWETGPMESNTSNKADYRQPEQQSKPKQEKPIDELDVKEGKFDHETTNKSQFTDKVIERQKPIRRSNEHQWETGPMETDTSNKADYRQPEQQSKPRQEKPKDELDIKEGTFDHETTNKTEFTDKLIERRKPIRRSSEHQWETGQMETDTSNKADYKQWEQQSKPKQEKPRDELEIQEGKFDHQTTNKTEFTDKLIERRKPIRRSSEHQWETGPMESDTSNKADYRQPEQQSKPRQEKPKDELDIKEGTFDYETTNKTEFTDKVIERRKPIRRSNEHQWETGPMETDTSNKADYRQPEQQSKPRQEKPKDELEIEEGKFDHQTTNKTEFTDKLIERRKPIRRSSEHQWETGPMESDTSNKADYRQPEQQRKPRQQKPKDELDIKEGTFDHETTNKTEFTDKLIERRKPIRRSSEHQWETGQMETDTSNKADYRQPEQQSKPRQEKPKDELDIKEGTFDHETTNKTEFTDKLIERRKPIRRSSEHQWETGQMETDTSNKADYRQPEQQSKPRQEKPKDELDIKEGTFDHKTTNKTEFTDKVIERRKPIRRSNEHQWETGPMETDTSNKADYRQPEQQSKPRQEKPKDELEIEEGKFDHQTTNKTEFTDKLIERRKPIRRSSEHQWETGPMESDTSNKADYRQPEQQRKPRQQKPKDELDIKEGTFDHETTNKTEFTDKLIERRKPIRRSSEHQWETGQMETDTSNKADYKQWEQQSKPKQEKPTDELEIEEGKFDHQTTNKTEFTDKLIERRKPIRRSSEHQWETGPMESDTSNKADYRQPEQQSKPKQEKPIDELDVKEGKFDHETTNKSEFSDKVIERRKPIRRSNEHQWETGPMETDTSNKADYRQPEQQSKPRQEKPKDELDIKEGTFDHETTNKTEFTDKLIERRKPIRRSSEHQWETGPMESDTSNKADYRQPEQQRKPRQQKPKDELDIKEGTFDHETTNKTEFTDKLIERRKPIRRSSEHQWETGQMETDTSNKADYKQWEQQSKPKQEKPRDELEIEEGKFDHQTTNKTEFTDKLIERRKPIRRSSEHQWETGPMESDTSNKADYRQPEQQSKPKQEKPIDELDVKEGKFDHETTNKSEFTDKVIERRKPIRRSNEHQWETGPMETDTSNKADYRQPEQQSKPRQEKPKDELDIKEGTFDHETTNKTEFTDKLIERRKPIRRSSEHQWETGQMETDTSNKADYRQPEQQSKPRQEKPKDELDIKEGTFDHKTTNKTEFTDKVIERRKPIRRSNEHQWETGPMETDTSNKADYRQPEQQSKPRQEKPKDELEIEEGKFDHQTTNKTEFTDKLIERRKPIRRSSEHQWETGPMESDTSNKADYRQPEQQRKPRQQKPKDELDIKEGTFDHETTNKTEFTDKLIERRKPIRRSSEHQWETGQMETDTSNKADYKQWEQQSKPKQEKPTDELEIEEGKFDHQTTNKTEFTDKLIERRKPIRRSSEHQWETGPMESDTSNKADYRQPEQQSKPKQEKPIDELDVKEGKFDHETTNKSEFSDKVIERRKPIRRSNEHQWETGPMETDTSNKADYRQPEQQSKPRQEKPKDELDIKEGTFDHETTNKTEFTDKLIERRKPIRRSSEHQWETGPMESDTSNKADYRQPEQQRKPRQQKPKDELDIKEGTFDHETTNKTEFTDKLIERRKPIRRSSEHQWETGQMETDTSNKADYKQWEQQSKPKQEKPRDELEIEEGKFDHQTTNKTEFTDKLIERRKPIRRSSEHQWETGPMESDTSNKADYRQPEQQSKPKQEKPIDELDVKEGKFDHETTNKSEFTDKVIERRKPIRRSNEHQWETGPMETDTSNKADYRQPEQQSKPRQEKPKDELDIKEGTFDHETTNKTEFTDKLIERRKPIRRSSEHQWETGQMETDTSNKADYRQPEQQSKPRQEKPKDELDIKEGTFDHKTTNKTEFTDKVIERRKPIRRSNEHQWETGPMETDTSNKADYRQPEQQSKPRQEKPKDELEIEEGKFDHQTTNKTEFTDKLIERRKPIRRSSEHQWETGPMESDTSNKADYRQPEQQSKPRQEKPKDELDIKEGTFDHETTNKTEFTDKLIERRKPIRRSNEHQWETGQMETDTSNKADYKQWEQQSKPKQEKPRDELEIEEGKFDHQTTNKIEFTDKVIERRKPIRRSSEHQWETGPMETDTSNKADYRQPEQQRKPRQQKPKDELDIKEGTFDHETTNKTEFTDKLIERRKPIRRSNEHQWETGQMETDTSNKADYRQPEQQSKPRQEKPKDELEIEEGKFDHQTTNKTEFTDKLIERRKPIRRSSEHQWETGPMESDTSNKADYRQPEQQSKPRQEKPKDELDIKEGTFDHETTNKTEFTDKLIDRRKPIRRSSEHQWETGQMETDTSNKADYKQWEQQSKPKQEKPRDELEIEEGKFDHQTTNKIEFTDKVIERRKPIRRSNEHQWETGPMETDTSNKADYRQPEQQSKPRQEKPKDELEIEEGKFDHQTTNKTEFTDKLIERRKPIRRSSEHQWETGPMESDTSNKADYRQPEQQSKPRQEKPKDELDIKEGTFDHETTNKTEFTDKLIERRKPIRRSSEHQWETGQMETDTSNKAYYKQWEQQSKPKQEKPRDELEIEEGKFDHQTTNKTEFTDKLIERRKPIRRSNEHQWETGPMETDTSNKADYRQPEQQSKPRQEKPKDELEIEEGKFDHQTTNKTEFTDKLIERRKPIRRSSEHQWETGPMESDTSNKADYRQPEQQRKPRQQKPKDELDIKEGTFDHETTNKTEFTDKLIERRKPIRRSNEHQWETGQMETDTSNKADYKQWEQQSKPKQEKPRDELEIEEGKFDHQTTNKIEFTDKLIERRKPIIRSSEHQWETGPMETDTSNKTDYRQPEQQSKPRKEKPKDELDIKEGTFDHETTNKSEFIDKLIERRRPIRRSSEHQWETGPMETDTSNKADYRQPEQQSRPKQEKPRDELDVKEGKFDHETTNKTEFTDKLIERRRPIRRSNEHQWETGPLETDTSNKADYRQPEQRSRPKQERPIDELDVREGKFDHETTNKFEFSDKLMERRQPIRRSSEHQWEVGPMETDTSNKAYYKQWEQQSRPKQEKPRDELDVKEGKFDHETTNKTEFTDKMIERRKPIRRSNEHQWGTGPMETDTSNKADYRQPEQQSRPKQEKPRDELDVKEGKFDHETTNKSEFTDKLIERRKPIRRSNEHQWETGPIETDTSNKADYRQPEQQSKPKQKKPKDELDIKEGTFDHETTNKTEFTDKVIERRKPIRRSNEHQWETGQMETDTSNKADYKQWEQQSKPKQEKPRDELEIEEGKFDHQTSNKTEFTDKLIERRKPIRRSNEHQWETGPMETDTSNKADYRQPEQQSRPKQEKPRDELDVKEGKFDHETTNRLEFSDKLVERRQPIRRSSEHQWEVGPMETDTSNKADYKQWEQQSRPKQEKPRDELDVKEGKFDHETTNRLEFSDKLMERRQPIRRSSEHQWEVGPMETDTSNKADYRQPEQQSRPKQEKPRDELDVKEGKFDHETTNKTEFTDKMIERRKPIRRSNEHQWGTGPMETDTSNKADYRQPEQQSRPKQEKPRDELDVKEGKFDHETTNKTEFTDKMIERRKPIRRSNEHQWGTGPMETDTSNKADYRQPEQQSKPKQEKPKDELDVKEGKFDHETTNKTEFTDKLIQRRQPIRRSSEHQWETGTMETDTSNKADYRQWEQQIRPNQEKPRDEIELEKGRFDDETTNKTEFTDKLIERRKPIRRSNEYQWETGPMASDTSNKTDYKNRQVIKYERDSENSTYGGKRSKIKEVIDTVVELSKPITRNDKQNSGSPAAETDVSQRYKDFTHSESTRLPEHNSSKDDSIEEGKVYVQTSHKQEITRKLNEYGSKGSPNTSINAQSNEVHESSANTEKYKGEIIEQVRKIVPQSLIVESPKFYGETTNKRDFKHVRVEQPQITVRKSQLEREKGEIETDTSTKRDYYKRNIIAQVQKIVPQSKVAQTGESSIGVSNKNYLNNAAGEISQEAKRVSKHVSETGAQPSAKVSTRAELKSIRRSGDNGLRDESNVSSQKIDKEIKNKIKVHELSKDKKETSESVSNTLSKSKNLERANIKSTVIEVVPLKYESQVMKRKELRETMNESKIFGEDKRYFETTSKAVFQQPSGAGRAKLLRPKTSYKPNNVGVFDGNTTNNLTYNNKSLVATARMKAVAPKSSGIFDSVNGNSVTNASVYKSEFKVSHSDPCPASLLETSASGFVFHNENQGHQFYMPAVDA
ncbi:Uncharacterised protein g10593 [Pycnogonum litorale]